MWNRTASTSAGGSIWSPDQIGRLKHEWGRLQWGYACHPVVSVVALSGDPPGEFQFDYRLRTLFINGAGQLDYTNHCSLHVQVGPGFPYTAPAVRPLAALFHPNISSDAVQIIPAWQSTDTLIDLVQRLGALLAFQTYDPYTPWNPTALEWVAQNAGYLPTDAQAHCSPEVGGDPLQRITRHGAQVIAQFRRELEQAGVAIVMAQAATGDIYRLAQRVQMGLDVFGAPNVPEALSRQAQALGQWAAQLPDAAPVLAELGQIKVAADAAQRAAAALEELEQTLADEFHKLQAIGQKVVQADASRVLASLPAVEEMQKLLVQLRGLLPKIDEALASAQHLTRPPPLSPRPAVLFGDELEHLIETQTQQQMASLASGQNRLKRGRREVVSLLERARLEAAALEKLIAWRQDADLRAKVQELLAQITTWGSAGVQAYFATTGAGRQGPFEFEQDLELGTSPLVVRGVGRAGLEVLDVVHGVRLARKESGPLSLELPTQEGDPTFQLTLETTIRCEDLAVQLDYLVRQMQGLMGRLGGAPIPAPSWCGKALAVILEPATFAAFKAQHAITAARLQSLIGDLGALAPFKERLATFFLLQRLSQAVKRWQSEHQSARQSILSANERIGQIIARSGKDTMTDALVIPAKFEKDYNHSLDQREQARGEMERLDRLLSAAAKQARVRLESFSLMGHAQSPKFKVLAALPEQLSALSSAMSDAALAPVIAELASMLGVQFAVKTPGTRLARPLS